VPAHSPSGAASALGSHGGSPSRDGIDVAVPSVITAVDDSSPCLITSDEASGTPAEQVSPDQVLASLAAGVRLFRSNDGRFFAQVPVGDRLEVFGLKSAGFRDWLIRGYLIDQPAPPSDPVLVLNGEQASAKSTLVKVVRDTHQAVHQAHGNRREQGRRIGQLAKEHRKVRQ
jgi:hypothetical protein